MSLTTTDDPEIAILSAILKSEGKCLDDVTLTGDQFQQPRYGDMFAAMQRTWDAGRPVEAFTLAEAHPNETAFLFSLTSLPGVPASAPYYADIIRKRALRRRLSAVGAALSDLPSNMEDTELADHARVLIENAIGPAASKVRFVRDILPSVIARMDAKDVFVPSPWPTLNAAIGGFRPGAVYVVAARPGVGKTVIAAQIAAQLAEHGNVAFASLEMTEDELVARLISERLRINVGAIKDARMKEHDWTKLRDGRSKLESLRIAIDDRSGVSAGDVRSFARSVAREGRLSGVVVDYMQLMVSRERMDRHLQVAEFSRRLKIMAKDLQVPVIALSQLNRNSEASALAVPKLSDLRESGAIEQDADVVMLLRREGEFPSEHMVIDVAKNRHGETGEVDLSWDGGYSRAVDWGHRD